MVTTSEPATEVPKPPPPWGHVVSHCGVSHSPLTPTSRPLLAATPNMVLALVAPHLMATSRPSPRMGKNKEESAVVRRTPSTYIHIVTLYILPSHLSTHGASCSQSTSARPVTLLSRHTPIRGRTHTSNLLIITASAHIPYQYVLITYLFRHFRPYFQPFSPSPVGRRKERAEPREQEEQPRARTRRYRTEKVRKKYRHPTGQRAHHILRASTKNQRTQARTPN